LITCGKDMVLCKWRFWGWMGSPLLATNRRPHVNCIPFGKWLWVNRQLIVIDMGPNWTGHHVERCVCWSFQVLNSDMSHTPIFAGMRCFELWSFGEITMHCDSITLPNKCFKCFSLFLFFLGWGWGCCCSTYLTPNEPDNTRQLVLF
jgi:hypothetical protein